MEENYFWWNVLGIEGSLTMSLSFILFMLMLLVEPGLILIFNYKFSFQLLLFK